MNDFYEHIAPYYHLIFDDWEATIAYQSKLLSGIIREQWGNGATSVLDVSCGTGTQSIALATAGFDVTASDLSPGMIERARNEAEQRDLSISFSVCDMRDCHRQHGSGFDVVVCAGNALPHLLTDADILTALQPMYACLRPGGGVLITMRQYDQEKHGTNLFKPFGIREEGNHRFIIFQVWDFDGPLYDFTMYFVKEDRSSGVTTVDTARSRYYALSPDHLVTLLDQAGFTNTHRLDDEYSHAAIVVGTRPE